MRKPFHLLVFVLVLALAYATAQTSGSSPSTNGQTTTPSQPQSSQSGTTQTPSTSPNTSQSPLTPNEPPNSQTSPNGSMTPTPSSPEQAPSSQQQTPVAPAAGGDIQMQVQNALQKEPTLSNDNINVSVTDDAIELNGTVANNKEKQTAKRIAQSYAGNRKVKEHLTVSGQAPDKNATNPPGSTTNPSSTMPPDQNSTTKPPSSSHPPRK